MPESTKTIRDVDIHVGKRIRHLRLMKGVTQQQLADRIGIKFQQVQKYETGANRVSASRMWDIAVALEVPVSTFFEGIDGQSPSNAAMTLSNEALVVGRKYDRLSPQAQKAVRETVDLFPVKDSA